MRRWLVPGGILVVGSAVAGYQWAGGDRIAALIALVVAVGLSWWFRRLLRPGEHVDLAQAPADRVVVFWKPGCIHCVRLLERFDGHDGIAWVNIRKDPEAAAFVREHNDGNELTPTVRAPAGKVLTHPGPEAVALLLGER